MIPVSPGLLEDPFDVVRYSTFSCFRAGGELLSCGTIVRLSSMR
jgi:hypothetical protein